MEASNRGDQIELSVITITPTDLSAIKPILAALRAQTARERMEVLVVAPDECPASAEELKSFGAARLLETVRFRSLGKALLSGVQAASAPAVAYTEEHSYRHFRC